MSSVPVQLSPGAPLRLRRITVEEYHRMIRDGYFADDERFELIDGMILEKVSKNPPHESVRQRARKQIEPQLPATVTLRLEAPITLSRSEPEPDLAVACGSDDDYVTRHPGPRDVLLLIEVSDTTLDTDAGVKLAEYAREGIAPYLILNLAERCIERFDRPQGDRYAERLVFSIGQVLELTVAGQAVRIDVAALFDGLRA
ncbi:MAG: Uma2 family endonuclease [Tepidisphaeraceae bacterium]